MKIIEIICESFNKNTTDMPYYDRLMKDPDYAEQVGFWVSTKIMTPQAYIAKCNREFGVNTEESRRNSGKVEEYAALMKKGVKFPMLLLQYTFDGKFTQEGLHRAYAARDIGITRVPVLIVHEKAY